MLERRKSSNTHSKDQLEDVICASSLTDMHWDMYTVSVVDSFLYTLVFV